MDRKVLRIVPSAAIPLAEKMRQRIKRMPKPENVLECRCGSRSLLIEVTGAALIDGKVRGGTKVYICACCDRKGERVVIA